ncbi:hypothetical protein [Enterococcus xiangfangensis]|uniref:Uncharacterized protein n=1 Tax=Enterococcus xiangfangensis TaxID=1296537 RepID=A0ABU3F9B6_9ENTE|nr:hypothetical protein [Enterococcus xiangfangensis]MDT2759273.1 hypothetical protein [Enterococcus xiangfangensis]
MFIKKNEILLNTRYSKQLEELTDEEFEELVSRADNYIVMRTHFDYTQTKNPLIQQSLKIITWRLVDYLYYCDNELDIENRFEGIASESIGDYSYSLKSANSDVGIGLTGDDELDMLLDALTVGKQKPTYFNVKGSARKRGGKCVF